MDKKCPNLYQRARLSTGMSQERAAELLGLSPESLKQYEGGKTVPKDETAGAGARAGHGHAGRDAGGDAKAFAHGEHRSPEPSARRDGPTGRPAPDRGGRRDRRG